MHCVLKLQDVELLLESWALAWVPSVVLLVVTRLDLAASLGR
jgi:hypothetical protein